MKNDKASRDILTEVASTVAGALLAVGETHDAGLTTKQIRASLSFCDIKFGDLASNIALTQAKKMHLSPSELAEKVAEQLREAHSIREVSIAGPGFLNLRLQPEVWQSYAMSLTKDFYRRQSGEGKRINIEFISANPTGPLVLVNAWGGYYGDVLANVFASQGWEVTREYYLNDGGNQITQLGRAIQQAAGKKFSEEEAAELYRGPYVDRLAADLTADYGSAERLCDLDPQVVGDTAKQIIFEQLIQPTLKRLGIHHEVVTPETTLDNKRTLERLKELSALEERDGALWLSGVAAGLDQDEVLVRSYDAQETYFLKDITYQAGKLEERGYDRAVTIVGPDHHGQEKRLLAALALLGADGFVPLWTQTVRLVKDGVEFKMSKRRGNYIVLDEFLDQVPSDTARFFFALRDPSSHLDLDLDEITAQNKHNLLFYVMYSYVRSHSVMAKAAIEGPFEVSAQYLDQSEIALLRGMVEIEEKVIMACQSYHVHPILYSFIDLASRYHDWYEQHPILKAESDEVRDHRLALVQRFMVVAEGIFELIGITAVERM